MNTMEPAKIPPPIETGAEVPLGQVDAELTRQLKAARIDLHTPVQLVRMSNLIVYCTCNDVLDRVQSSVARIVANHPARVILLLGDPDDSQKDLTAKVLVRKVDDRKGLVSEQVTLRASKGSIERLPFAVRNLLIGDLPTNLWWACPTAPSLVGPILDSLAEHAQQVIYDSLGWQDATKAVAGTSSWLDRFERDASTSSWRIASDLNWRRAKGWRRLLTQALDPSTSPGLLANLREVEIEHGPDAITQAWQMAGWLASRLGWSVASHKVKSGNEFTFQLQGSQGMVSLKIQQRADGPSEIARIRVAGGPGGAAGALEFVSEEGGRLSVKPEGAETVARTVASQPRPITELIARQLSDREPDPVFRESMKLAQQLARRAVS